MKIFISYRRSDSESIAGRLRDRLKATPDVTEVFLDIGGLKPGTNFAKIFEALKESKVCLVLIGTDWVGVREDATTTRIMDDNDFVRREVAQALDMYKDGNILLIPVLLNGMEMPGEDSLPVDLNPICTILGFNLRNDSFDQNLRDLEDVLFSRDAPTRIEDDLIRHPWRTLFLKMTAGFLLAGLVLIVLAATYKALTGNPLEEFFGGVEYMVLFILSVLLLGTGLGAKFLLRR